MSSSPAPKPAPIRRSRGGCRECRRRHRRCDEAKPACAYCSGVGITCDYSKELSWGGRPFKKSRFGQCLGQNSGVGVFKVNSEASGRARRRRHEGGSSSQRCERQFLSHQFVYTTSQEPIPIYNVAEDEIPDCRDGVDTTEECLGGLVSPMLSLDEELPLLESPVLSTPRSGLELYPMTLRSKNLLGYFQYGMSRSLSCHEGIQNDICSALIPMAMESSHLFAAMLCAAGSHRLSIGLENLDDVLRLRSIAIHRLTETLTSSDPYNLISALATSLVLCMSEVVSPDATAGDWRVHLSGASALLKRLDGSPQIDESSTRYLRRFYASLRVIAAGCGISEGQGLYEDDAMKKQDYIDDLAGFSTALVPVFESISKMDQAATSRSRDDDEAFDLTTTLLPQKLRLIERVRTMLLFRTTVLRPELNASLPMATKTDFGLLDEAYHHMALLQLYERVAGSQQGCDYDTEIQTSVERIISCICAMDIIAKPCPAVATLPPLFAAGCSATLTHDRTRILGLLCQVRACFGMGNVTSTCRFLEKRWAHSNARIMLERQDIDGLGFLPY